MQLHHSADQLGSLQKHSPWDYQMWFEFLESSWLVFFYVLYIGHSWYFHIIPMCLRKWITHFLLGSLFATFHKAFVLAHHHGAAQRAKRLTFLFFVFVFYKPPLAWATWRQETLRALLFPIPSREPCTNWNLSNSFQMNENQASCICVSIQFLYPFTFILTLWSSL